MIFDGLTITICGVLLVLTLLSVVLDLFRKKVSSCEIHDDAENGKPVSVVIIADNNDGALKANLPLFLSQDYPGGFEVIVVVASDGDDTAGVIESYSKVPNFYATYVPKSSRYMSRRKLAVTLGVKAAKHEWVLLTDAACCPVTDKWIGNMSSCRHRGVDMVYGYGNYAEGTGQFKMFSRFHREYLLIREAQSGMGYGMAGCNLMFRKSMFMAGNGFQGNLKYLRGEYDFLVNKYASTGNIAVCLEPEAFIVEETPTAKGWHDRNVFYFETRRHLERSVRHRALFNSDMLSLHACFVAALCALGYSILFHNWLILLFSAIALFVPLIVRTLFARRAMDAFGLVVPWFKVVPFELRLVWHGLKYAVAYRMSDKYEFISHKS